MKLSLGFSPCPNDTFIFDAMVHGKVDTEGLTFEPLLTDVEELNQLALAGAIAVTKLSYHAYAHVADRYALLHAGSALGQGVGPLLIARSALPLDQLAQYRIAIPGELTTAHFLLRLAFPAAQHKVPMVFSEIEPALLAGAVEVGLIIHENRFTYAEKGLVKLLDLGTYWEENTGLPIPLGGIAVQRSLPVAVQQRVNRVMARSVAYARQQPQAAAAYVRAHAQEMAETVMYQHIDLYVNDYTQDLGPDGRAAIEKMFALAQAKGLIGDYPAVLFVPTGPASA